MTDERRRYKFFSQVEVKDPLDSAIAAQAFQKPDIAVYASGRGKIILGTTTGYIHIIDRNLHTQSFLAYDNGRVLLLKQVKQRNYLLTVGDEGQHDALPALKVWDLDRTDSKDTGADGRPIPQCMKILRIQTGTTPFPLTAFAAVENLTQIAVGLANGVVILIRGDIHKEKTIRQRIIFEANEPITALGFREQTKSTILFITTTSQTLSFNTSAPKSKTTVLEEQGCGLNCAVMNESTHEMVVGGEKGISFFNATGRNHFTFYPMPKVVVRSFRSNYVIIASPSINATTTLEQRRLSAPQTNGSSAQAVNSAYTTAMSSQDTAMLNATGDVSKVVILDTTNNFEVFSGSFAGAVRDIVCEWGSIWLISSDGPVFRLDELDTQSKLEILLKRQQFSTAINLARSLNYDDTGIMEIFRKYADFLYSDGDLDGAMQQYIRTIGKLEPSYVIRRYLDPQRVHNLIAYLQALHQQRLADSDHTTLLLNCYTKIKDVTNLHTFVSSDEKWSFDAITAITVCRRSGYFSQALLLAKRYGQDDAYLDILVQDQEDYGLAIDFLRESGPTRAEEYLTKYGKTLLQNIPETTTQFFIDLCIGQLPLPAAGKGRRSRMSPAKGVVHSALTPQTNGPSTTSPQHQTPSTPSKVHKKLQYTPPPVQKFLWMFVDHTDHLIILLEKVLERHHLIHKSMSNTSPDWTIDKDEDAKSIWTTLLDLYLRRFQVELQADDQPGNSETAPITNGATKDIRQKILSHLNVSDVQYDVNQALVLCELRTFDEGVVFILEKMGSYRQILEFWMQNGVPERVLDALDNHGPKDPSLYPLALTYISSSPAIMRRSRQQLLDILQRISDTPQNDDEATQSALSPIQVIEAFGAHGIATVGLVSDYIRAWFSHRAEEMREDESSFKEYQQETRQKKDALQRVYSMTQIVDPTNSTCQKCDQQLFYPAVQYACDHVYHRACLTNDTGKRSPPQTCPECANHDEMVKEIRQNQKADAHQHDMFLIEAKNMATKVNGADLEVDLSTSPNATFPERADGNAAPPRRTSVSQLPKPRALRPFNTAEIKILLLENINATAVEAFKKQGYQVETYTKSLQGEELLEKIRDVQVIGIRSKTKLTRAVLAEAKNLLAIGCFCIGTNQVDLICAAKQGIAVFNSPFSNSRSVAELVIAEIITLSRQLGDRSSEMHQGIWNKVSKNCYEIRGKTLGIVGYGHIGTQLSVLAEAMGMKVYFYDVLTIMPLGTAQQVDSLEDLLAVSDFVTLHVPETEDTKNMMGEREIMGYMKKGAYLINASRGTVVDIPALVKALKSGHLGGAAIDVYPKEPASNGNTFSEYYPELMSCPNTILTPHIGGSTEEAQRMIGIEVSTSLIRYVNQGSSTGAVNYPEIDLRAIREEESSTVRLLYSHQNVPGVLREINEILANHNVDKQFSDSRGDIAYLMADINDVTVQEIENIYNKRDMKVIDKIRQAEAENRPFWSFEYFPPKTQQGVLNLYDRLERMQSLGPEFIDVTWGAGGTTSDATSAIVETAQSVYGLETMMHLTCTNMPKEKVDVALKRAKECGCQNILALRGDPPRGQVEWEECEGGFSNAGDLVRYIRKEYGDYFGIAVAGHPEGHPDSASQEEELAHLKDKIDAGADLVVTQLFFDPKLFLSYVDRCRAAGITCPILPGIFPLQNYGGLQRIVNFNGHYVPDELWKDLEPIKDDDAKIKEYGVQKAISWVKELMAAGITGFHFYTFNLEKSTRLVLEGMKFVAPLEVVKPLPWSPSLHRKRTKETVRPIFWRNRTASYIQRTESWDEFPNGRWGDSRSPAFGDLDFHGISLKYGKQDCLGMWGTPTTAEEISALFARYLKGQVASLPWSAQQLAGETFVINDLLQDINLKGYWTINSQPAVNGIKSSDRTFGWGPSNGYVYQKAYIEFFTSPELLDELIARIDTKDQDLITFYAMNRAGDLRTNSKSDLPNAVTWGVFPNKEIVQPTIVDGSAFAVWKDEAFALWAKWRSIYEEGSTSHALIGQVIETYYLVNIVHNDFQDADGLWTLLLG